jgi:arylsulfatase A-like enzyme
VKDTWRVPTLLLAGLLACGAAARAGEPARAPAGNVILIGWDGTLRDDMAALKAAGQLPNLDRLTSSGTLVATQVTTGSTQTKPGWAEILTGYSAERLKILNNRDYRPIPRGYTVFERLKKRYGAGVTTIFISGKINNLGARGPHTICINCVSREALLRRKTRWWSKDEVSTSVTKDGKPPVWDRRAGEPYFNAKWAFDLYLTGLGPADKVGEQALAALDKYGHKPFFAFFHFEEPDEEGHVYGESSPEYSAAIKAADAWLGRILGKLDELGIAGETTVYVTADHGFDKGGFNHYDAPRTFLAAGSGPRLRDGDRKDVTPTILERYGLDPKAFRPPLDGRSLAVK